MRGFITDDAIDFRLTTVLTGCESETSSHLTKHTSTIEAIAELKYSSNIGNQIEVLIIFVLSTKSLSDPFASRHELNGLNPLDHFIAKLVFDS